MDEQLHHDYMAEEWQLLQPADIEARFSSHRDETAIRRWALVLSSRFIPCRVEQDRVGWHLLVQSARAAEAVRHRAFWHSPFISRRVGKIHDVDVTSGCRRRRVAVYGATKPHGQSSPCRKRK